MNTLFARVTEWVNAHCIPFEAQNELFRILAAPPQADKGDKRAQSISDDMMDLVDRLGSEWDTVDPRAWRSLLVYAPRNAASVADSAMATDAERYRWLRDTLHSAKAGGGVEVNERLQGYETPELGEEVRIYWYQDTPVGFYEVKSSTLDAAIDATLAASKEKK